MIGMLALMVGLILAAMVLFALEVVTPSFGLIAALGVASLGGAICCAFVIDSTFGLVMMILLLVVMPPYIVVMVKLLPKTPLGRRLFLKSSPSGTGDAAPEHTTYQSLVGKEGEAISLLRPSGAVRVDGRRVVASAESGVIPRGAKIKVVGATGRNVVVRRLPDEQQTT